MNANNHMKMVVLDNVANRNAKNVVQQISWNNLRLFLQCPCCFYNHIKLRIKRPGIGPDSFALFKTIEAQYKAEFDHYRSIGKAHPLMIQQNINAIPYANDLLMAWRNPYQGYDQGGIRFTDPNLGVELYGGVDDIWINSQQELMIVEYKTTSITGPIILDTRNRWHKEYMKQLSFYAWLFKQNNYNVHEVGYFLFCNGMGDIDNPDSVIKFEKSLIPYIIDDSWVPDCIERAVNCLQQTNPPMPLLTCEYCLFFIRVAEQEINRQRQLWNIAYTYALNYANAKINVV